MSIYMYVYIYYYINMVIQVYIKYAKIIDLHCCKKYSNGNLDLKFVHKYYLFCFNIPIRKLIS